MGPPQEYLHLDDLEAGRRALYDDERKVVLEHDGAVGDHLLRFFAFKHLPPKLQGVSALFCELALAICLVRPSAERTVALRKLLESKDAAVRAAL
jgi:hypothetical protein